MVAPMRRSDQLPLLLPWSESVIWPATTGTKDKSENSLGIQVAASVLTPEIIINPYKIIWKQDIQCQAGFRVEHKATEG